MDLKILRFTTYHFRAFFALAALAFVSGCSTSTYEVLQNKRDQGNPRAAAYAADGFTLDHRSPEPRPFRAWQFYFKDCALVSRNPYPSKSEFECSDPK